MTGYEFISSIFSQLMPIFSGAPTTLLLICVGIKLVMLGNLNHSDAVYGLAHFKWTVLDVVLTVVVLILI